MTDGRFITHRSCGLSPADNVLLLKPALLMATATLFVIARSSHCVGLAAAYGHFQYENYFKLCSRKQTMETQQETDAENRRFSYHVEWYDPVAQLVRQYVLSYYDFDDTIDMYDLKNERMFLRRVKVDNVRLCDLKVGGHVNVLSRRLKIVDYARISTRQHFQRCKEKTLGLVKPDAMNYVGIILDAIWQNGFEILRLKSIRLNRREVVDFYEEDQGEPYFNELTNYLSSGPVVVIEMEADQAIRRWMDMVGPTDPSKARQTAPNSFRARYGIDCVRNAVHAASDADQCRRELDFLFPPTGPPRCNSACYDATTCAVILPHAIVDGVAGDIMTKITCSGLGITAMLKVTLDEADAEEFLAIYKGVVQEYPLMVTELCCGPCIALEVCGDNAQSALRQLVGPPDPELARHIRPNTIRALYGRTKAQNAIHCTDLPEDGKLEVEYFFRVQDGQ